MKNLNHIPKEFWVLTVETINKLLYPVTATTSGVGKLIEQKFSTLNDVQKIIAEQTLREATEKVSKISNLDLTKVVVKPQIIYTTLDNTDSQTDDSMRSLWANITAREMSEGSVHPEIIRLFSVLTAADLIVLSELHGQRLSIAKFLLKAFASVYTLGIYRDPKSFHHVYLSDLGLITDISGKWVITVKGKELVRCISELEVSKAKSAV